MAVGLATGVEKFAFRILRPAGLYADDRAAGELAPGPYEVELVTRRFTLSGDQPWPPAALRAGIAPTWDGPNPIEIFSERGQLMLRDARGRTVTSARRILSIRGEVVLKSASPPGHAHVYPGQTDIQLWAGALTVVNRVPLEEYVAGVVAAEMSSKAPSEALKAQAVVARSVALARRDAHRGAPFDLCATTHCQVYQGVPSERGAVERAVRKTRGFALSYRGRVVETPYSANCGGYTESAAELWGERNAPYLHGVLDWRSGGRLDLTDERTLSRWVRSRPRAYCGDGFGEHFRWTRTLSSSWLRRRLEKQLGVRIGPVRAIRVLRRGVSGRATRVRIIGASGQYTIDGELRIRQTLGVPPLPSSCFVVEEEGGAFVLRGAGYGHGVGLCQDGAIGMARAGYNFAQILQHYFPETRLLRMY